MDKQYSLTVLALTTKRPKFLEQCLQSLVTQTRRPDKIQVVIRSDDDEGLKVLQKYAANSGVEIGYVFFDQVGMTKARNRGLREIYTELVCFIDDDAVAEKHWLENIERNFSDPLVGAVGGLCLAPDSSACILNSSTKLLKFNKWGKVSNYGADYTLGNPVFVDHLRGTNMTFQRKLIDNFGENLLGHCFREDMDMCLKIKKKGYKIVFDPKVVVWHFSAPSLDTSRQAVKKKIYESHANNTYVALKHLNCFYRCFFVLFTFLWGDGAVPGLVKYIFRAARYKDVHQLIKCLPWAMKGKVAGIKIYLGRIVKPNVWFFVSSLSAKTGGEKTNLRFIEKLIEEKESVQIVSLGDVYRRYYRRKNKNVFFYYLVRLGLMIDIFFHNLGKKGIIVYDYYYSGILTLYLIVEKYLFNTPIVGIVYHFDRYRSENKNTYSRWRFFWEKLPLLISNQIVTDSQFCFREISSLGIDERKITVISPGLDKNSKPVIRDFAVKKKNSDFQLLFVGHLSPRKGAIYLLEAIKLLIVKHSLHLNLVGEQGNNQEYYQQITKFIQENNLEKHVTICGRVKDNLLAEFYSQADLFVLPSLWEGFGIVLIEAMSYGLPIVSSCVAAIPELIEDGKNGLLVAPKNPEALAEAIARLIENTTLRKQMSEEGYRRAIETPSWQDCGREFYDIVQGLAK